MSEPFIGQIMMFGGNFAPRGWAVCNGQLLPIDQNTALFSILGTTYGGDGRTTFGLPDLRGRVAIHPGTGPGLSPYQLGAKGGSESNTLTTNNLPSHSHAVRAYGSKSTKSSENPSGTTWAVTSDEIYAQEAPNVDMNSANLAATGGGQPVNNRQPYQCVNYIIALVGIYPSRS